MAVVIGHLSHPGFAHCIQLPGKVADQCVIESAERKVEKDKKSTIKQTNTMDVGKHNRPCCDEQPNETEYFCTSQKTLF